jgi:hypothetical protein
MNILQLEEAAFTEAMVNVMCPADSFTPNGVDCGLSINSGSPESKRGAIPTLPEATRARIGPRPSAYVRFSPVISAPVMCWDMSGLPNL